MKAIGRLLALLVLLSAAQLYADVITVDLGTGGVVNFRASGAAQRVTFPSALPLVSADSANGTNLVITPPASGYFLFTSVSNGQGLFSVPTGATFTAGSAASGILSGSISSIILTGSTTTGARTTFTMQLTFSNMSFQNCTGPGCVNSSSLQTFSQASTGTLDVSFSMANGAANSLAALLAMNGPHNNNALSGAMDATVTPEPASLALFGTGLLFVGMRLTRKRKRE